MNKNEFADVEVLTPSINISDLNTSVATLEKGVTIKLSKLFPKNSFNYQNSRFDGTNFNNIKVPNDDFETIEKAIDTEGYLNRSVNRFVEMIWKGGFDFVGDNDRAVTYVKKRFHEMSIITKKPTLLFFEELTRELVAHSNAFIYKKRSSTIQSGKKTNQYGKILDPIAFFILLKTSNVYIETNEYDLIDYYIYDIPKYDNKAPFFKYINIEQQTVKLEPYDIVHFYYNKKPGSFYGKPNISAVLDDARSLRRMEENVEILVFQHTIPLIHCAIGTDTTPADKTEVDTAAVEFANMLTEGMITTSHRHKIEVLGKNSDGLDVIPYLEYFKCRMLAGVGQSKASLGETGDSTKASAQVFTDALTDMANRYKKDIQAFVENQLIYDLLLEGGFNPFLVSVKLFIPEINLSLKYKEEYQTMQLFQGGVISEDEARKKLGYKPLTNDQRKKMYYKLTRKATTTAASNSAEIDAQLNPTNQHTQE